MLWGSHKGKHAALLFEAICVATVGNRRLEQIVTCSSKDATDKFPPHTHQITWHISVNSVGVQLDIFDSIVCLVSKALCQKFLTLLAVHINTPCKVIIQNCVLKSYYFLWEAEPSLTTRKQQIHRIQRSPGNSWMLADLTPGGQM